MIILDTNVISELMRAKPSAKVATWVAQQPGTELFTTSITEAEIFYGIELLGKGKRREGLLAAAEAMFSEDFAGRVFAFDSDAARVFAKIAAARRVRRRGHVRLRNDDIDIVKRQFHQRKQWRIHVSYGPGIHFVHACGEPGCELNDYRWLNEHNGWHVDVRWND
jgi:predicted nucleic acid-binding protein